MYNGTAFRISNAACTVAFLLSVPVTADDTVNRQLKLNDTDSTIAISDSRGTILVYNKQSPPVPENVEAVYHRSGFAHPVATPTGKVVTAVFPIDHKHQDGIFSAWVNTSWNGRKIDFWNIAGGTGRVLHEKVVSTFVNESSTGFEVDLIHRAVAEPVVDILRERWKITAYPTDGSFRCFDLQTTQTALTDIPLIVNRYHYGGIALRGPTRWVQQNDRDKQSGAETREPSEFLNDLGSDRKKGNHQKARWVSLYGEIAGKTVSITVLSHPNNFRSPQAARLHPSKPYFCYTPCFEDEFQIDKDHPFTGRYRYLVTDTEPDPNWLNKQWDTWTTQ